MNYLFIFLLLLPVKLLLKLIRRPSGKNLVIQTAKIGDFVNITPLLRHLGVSDALLSRTVSPLAECLYIEDYKQNLFSKILLGLRLVNRYSHVYLLHPNNSNLFFAALCNAPDKQFLSTYTRRWYHRLSYLTASGVVEHRRDTLTLQNYLRLADRSLSWRPRLTPSTSVSASPPVTRPKRYRRRCRAKYSRCWRVCRAATTFSARPMNKAISMRWSATPAPRQTSSA